MSAPGTSATLKRRGLMSGSEHFSDISASPAHVGEWWRVQRVAATLQSLRKDGVFRMGYRGRLYFTEKQKAEIWDR